MSKFVPQAKTLISELVNAGATSLLSGDKAIAVKALKTKALYPSECQMILAEMEWIKRKKPFFNLHQPVIDCLENTSLNVTPTQIPKSVVNELLAVCVKLPIETKNNLLRGITHFYINFIQEFAELIKYDDGHEEAVFSGDTGVNFSYHTVDSVFCFSTRSGETFTYTDEYYEKNYSPGSYKYEEGLCDYSSIGDRHRLIARLGIGVLMLASDPDYIDPILLARDKGKTLNEEQHAKAVDRAKRNGVFGFDIGARLEVSPHMRRPHFAIRWTGKNAAIPKLVPIKASIVNKRKITEVPTGYEVAN